MKKIFTLILLAAVVALVIACDSKQDYNPDSALSATQKNAIVTSIVRYSTKRPDQATDADKFDVKYDSFYRAQATKVRLEQYFAKGDQFYFLISQPAPSLVEKRNATGGRFELNDSGEITEYEEIFRTWKMVPDTLKQRSYFLFDKMVKGESLEPWLTKNSKGLEYIEFPDDNTFYNEASRTWKVRGL